MTAKLTSTYATWSDPDDVPELTEVIYKKAYLYDRATLKALAWPKTLVIKDPIKLRLDGDVLEALRANGEG